MKDKGYKTAAVMVAHPDDETLWAGGNDSQSTRVELVYRHSVPGK